MKQLVAIVWCMKAGGITAWLDKHAFEPIQSQLEGN